MRSGRQDLQLSFIVIAICLFLVSINYVYAKQEVEMAVRPFAIDPVNRHLLVDGIFDVSFDEHIIGVFLENKGKNIISNATAAASFPTGSGIKIIEGTCEFEDLELNKPAFGFFRARFGNSKPGKYPLILNISGEVSGKPDSWETSRDLFVIRSEFDPNVPNQWTVHVPEGKLIASIYEFNKGSNPGSSMQPRQYEWFIEYVKPYKNRDSDLAFNDPWWKVMGSIVPAGAGPTAVDMRITELFGSDCGDTVRSIGRASFSAASIAVTADDTDPFRMGQGEVEPGEGEFTEREGVAVSMEYSPGSAVGTPFDADVEWTYTRTTNVKTYPPRKFKKSVRTTHFAKKPEVKIKRRKSSRGREFFITAQTHKAMGINKQAYFVANLFRTDDTQLKDVVRSIILRDDGHQGDSIAGDGIYTGVGTVEHLPRDTSLNVFVFGFDINNAAVSDDPLTAATKIGGILISTPPFKLFPVKPPIKGKKKSPLEPEKNIIKVVGAAGKTAKIILKTPGDLKICIGGWLSRDFDRPGISDENGDGIPDDGFPARDIGGSFSGGVKLSIGYKTPIKRHVIGVSGGYRFPTEGTFEFGSDESEFSSYAIPLELFLKIPVGKKSFLRLAAGADIYKSTINSSIGTFGDSGTGSHFSLGTGYFLAKNLALTFDVGYVSAKLNNFTRTEMGNVWRLIIHDAPGEECLEEKDVNATPLPFDKPLEIDFTGLQLSVGIKLCLK